MVTQHNIGKYYLVDVGYRNKPGFLAPYQGTRYHLNEIRGRLSESLKEIFNNRHSSLRNAMECAFGVLKKRWAILDATQYFDFDTQVNIVIACCVLHNHIMGVDPHDQYTREGICEADRQNISGGDEFVDESASANSLAPRLQRNELARWSTFRDQIGL
uniref:DDE Tnp4 domain-containing protein n=1 Tax=Nelumbo nucifera TaxID=4432 RepID=A0A822XII6_NELNU|nr:TPA_asm: hypothetical protein HUJ06_020986 [Nelumbo nucifera]